MASANDTQVGGSHYQSDWQHWDFVDNPLWHLGWQESCAIKYISRWRKKNGLQDLQKAIHYTDKLIEIVKAGWRQPYGRVPMPAVIRYCDANDLSGVEREAVTVLSRWSELWTLQAVRAGILALIAEVEEIQQQLEIAQSMKADG